MGVSPVIVLLVIGGCSLARGNGNVEDAEKMGSSERFLGKDCFPMRSSAIQPFPSRSDILARPETLSYEGCDRAWKRYKRSRNSESRAKVVKACAYALRRVRRRCRMLTKTVLLQLAKEIMQGQACERGPFSARFEPDEDFILCGIAFRSCTESSVSTACVECVEKCGKVSIQCAIVASLDNDIVSACVAPVALSAAAVCISAVPGLGKVCYF